ncbi:MAG: nitrous oxide reductase family maturation protein NosD [Lysinibacillus sp.]|nr:nitrous oxide reductase family maturation protein NosD [Lysinibacillus sp.]
MKRCIFLLFLMLLLGSLNLHATYAEDLQSLLDNLGDGEVLHLENKTYEGNIVITKPMEIVGSEDTVIRGDGLGNVISIEAPGVKLKNLTVTNSSMTRNDAEEYAAIKIHSDGNIINNVTITDSFHGIYLSQAHENVIENCHIIGLGDGTIGGQGNGLHIYFSNNNLFKNNFVDGARDGMYFEYSNDSEAFGNYLTNNRYGLHYMYSHDNTFKENIFTSNKGGAAVMESFRNVLENNQFIYNYGHKSFGILLLMANDTVIENNTLFFNQRGLYIDSSTNNLIQNNHIVQNHIGIELWASSNEQVFTLNKIEENIIPVFTLGGQGRNYWNKDGQGNFWGSDFPVIDLDQNKIGDVPVIYQSSLTELIGDQELTYLFLKSPAIKIYDKVNQLFNEPKIMFEDSSPIVMDKWINTYWVWLMLAGIFVLFIIVKGRFLLCTMYGRNGRKM